MSRNRWTPTRVVTVTVSAVFDESDSLDNDELVDVAAEALSGALPEGFQYAGSTGVARPRSSSIWRPRRMPARASSKRPWSASRLACSARSVASALRSPLTSPMMTSHRSIASSTGVDPKTAAAA